MLRLGPHADWNEAESTHQSSLDEPEADMLYWGARSEPRVVGALIMGIKGDRWPRRRWECFAYHRPLKKPANYGQAHPA